MKRSILPKEKIIEALETLIVSGDRIVLEGDNQKQADFLSRFRVEGRCEEASRSAPDYFEQ